MARICGNGHPSPVGALPNLQAREAPFVVVSLFTLLGVPRLSQQTMLSDVGVVLAGPDGRQSANFVYGPEYDAP
jgi:hypothetical protein